MTELRIMRGYSGSGKSTLAKAWVAQNPANRVRVSRDDLRAMLTGNPAKTVLDTAGEAQVTAIQTAAASGALRAGKSVVVDNTNLRLKFARKWADLAVQHGVSFVVQDVETAPGACIERNSLRLDAVPTHVIETQAKKFPLGRWPVVTASVTQAVYTPYVPDTSLPMAFGFDLDGTLAEMVDRGPYDSHLYHTDVPNDALRRVLHELDNGRYSIVIFSGRSDEHRATVETWLREHGIPFDLLVMRKSGDNRNDAIVKSELFDAFIAPNYNFLAQFDDRDRVVHALRAKGIAVWQVAPGAF